VGSIVGARPRIISAVFSAMAASAKSWLRDAHPERARHRSHS
jgi:hypothetical protein